LDFAFLVVRTQQVVGARIVDVGEGNGWAERAGDFIGGGAREVGGIDNPFALLL